MDTNFTVGNVNFSNCLSSTQFKITAESSKPEKAQEISIVKCDNRYVVIIDKRVIKDVSDFKITTSADGTTELIIHIKTKCDKFTTDMRTFV